MLKYEKQQLAASNVEFWDKGCITSLIGALSGLLRIGECYVEIWTSSITPINEFARESDVGKRDFQDPAGNMATQPGSDAGNSSASMGHVRSRK